MGSCVGVQESIDNSTTDIVPVHQDENAQRFVYISEAVIIPIINMLGILTNSCSLFILPKTRIVNTFKICLIALTICDLCYSLLSFTNMMLEIGFYDGDIPHGHFQGAAIASYVLYYISSVFICTSATIVITIVVIRHWIVKDPLKARTNLTSRRTKKTCICLFLLTLLLYIPTSLNILWQSCHRDDTTPICISINEKIPNLQTITSYYLYLLTVIYGPFMVLLYVISLIGIKLSLAKSKESIEALSARKTGRESKLRVQRTARITTLLLIILLIDTICTIPICCQAIAIVIAPEQTVFCPTNMTYKVFDSVAEIFYNMRPTYNFWLYAFQHEEFKYHLLRAFLHLKNTKVFKWATEKKNTLSRTASTIQPTGAVSYEPASPVTSITSLPVSSDV